MAKKKVQLALGSGGARGIAHIGVIEKLLEEDYEITAITGSSMGAVIGGIYAAGYLPQYRDWLIKLTKTDVYRLFDLTIARGGFIKGDRIFNILKDITGDIEIEKLPIPFTAVATDIINRNEVHFKAGNLYKALRASTGMPGILTPVAENGQLFVDGGVLNPLPLNLLTPQKDVLTVAVSLNGGFAAEQAPEKPLVQAVNEATQNEGILVKLKNYFQWLNSETDKPEEKIEVKEEALPPEKEKPITPVPSLSMFDLMSTSYDITLDKLVDLTLADHHADMVIEIPRSVCGVFEFYRATELIEAGRVGYEKAKEKMAGRKA